MCWFDWVIVTICLSFIVSCDISLTTIFIVSHFDWLNPYDICVIITNTSSTNTLIKATNDSITYTVIVVITVATISSTVFSKTLCYGLCYEVTVSVVSTAVNMIVLRWRSFRCTVAVFVITRWETMTVCVWVIVRIGQLKSAWLIIASVCR